MAVVIPAFNAGNRLERVLETLPDLVDFAVVVDDGSGAGPDLDRPRGPLDVVSANHPRNLGVGAAILTGYRVAARRGADAAVVMAADGQMDPADLQPLLGPILDGGADYVKGDRLSHRHCPERMPPVRRFGNYCLTFLTRMVTGRWDLMDSQCGYTAIRLDLLERLPLDWLYPRYGFPNDMIAAVQGAGGRIAEVVVTPVYGGEPSGIRPWTAALVYPMILVRGIGVRLLASVHSRSHGPTRSLEGSAPSGGSGEEP